ncbi:hypothetical protein [Methylacidimicrobium sp. B4]|uniref:hypothetical protein n=1 Tax=Methylacidimicrobium sp. B4 TaxID=2796139 RepID=UPI0004B9F9A2|nr:hypothetical protein [Methylacidimicrobium sp. B4]QSR84689.1 hypothetical protein MacB4_10950 [Methylacidimicrobium sp. B4]
MAIENPCAEEILKALGANPEWREAVRKELCGEEAPQLSPEEGEAWRQLLETHAILESGIQEWMRFAAATGKRVESMARRVEELRKPMDLIDSWALAEWASERIGKIVWQSGVKLVAGGERDLVAHLIEWAAEAQVLSGNERRDLLLADFLGLGMERWSGEPVCVALLFSKSWSFEDIECAARHGDLWLKVVMAAEAARPGTVTSFLARPPSKRHAVVASFSRNCLEEEKAIRRQVCYETIVREI